MTEPRAVLVELVDLPKDLQADWRRFYDAVYLPSRLGVPGVVAGRRAVGIQNPDQQAIKDADPVELGLIELENGGVVESAEWREAENRVAAEHGAEVQVHNAHTTVRVYRQIITTVEDYVPADGPEVIHGAFYEMPAQHHDEFNDWYNTEHIPIQMTVPGYFNTRRFQGITDPERFVALYDVEKLTNTRGAAARGAMESAWSERIRNKLAGERARRLFEVEAVLVASHARR